MFNKLRFQHKLFIFISIILFVILLISGNVFYWYTVSILKDNISNIQTQTTQKLQEQLDDMLYDMDRQAISINSSNYIMDMVKDIPYTSENFFDANPNINNRLRAALFSYTSLEPLKGRISIITRYMDYTDLNNKLDNQIVTKDYVRGIDRIKEIMASDKYKEYLPPHQDDWTDNIDTVFSVVRPLRDNYGVYGVVEINRRIEELDKLFEFREQNNTQIGIILDDKYSPIYSNKKEHPFNDHLIGRDIDGKIGSFIFEDKYICTYSRLENVDWTIVLIEDMTTMNKPVMRLKIIIITTYIIAFIAILCVVYLLSKHLSKPLGNLKAAIVNIDMDDLRINHDTTNDEVTVLQFAFQDLLDEIKQSQVEILEAKTREAHAHLLALQAQLNPHFLYNTLAVIGAHGQKKGNIEVVKMCANLSNMLRYSADMCDKVTLSKEVMQIKCYLDIMNNRFRGLMNYEMDLGDVDLDEITVPKLTIQPIIENCFNHGFKDIEYPWKISLKFYTEHSNWVLRISDNGKGFNQQALENINNQIEHIQGSYHTITEHAQSVGIGMLNTFVRLHIYCKGKEKISIYNENGAVVEIGGPLRGES